MSQNLNDVMQLSLFGNLFGGSQQNQAQTQNYQTNQGTSPTLTTTGTSIGLTGGSSYTNVNPAWINMGGLASSYGTQGFTFKTPSVAERLRSMEWNGTVSKGGMEFKCCPFCHGICDVEKAYENLYFGQSFDLVKALPKSWKGHRPACEYVAEVLPSLAWEELSGNDDAKT